MNLQISNPEFINQELETEAYSANVGIQVDRLVSFGEHNLEDWVEIIYVCHNTPGR